VDGGHEETTQNNIKTRCCRNRPTNVLDIFNESCLMSPSCEMLNALVM
jgi:hypothetical protein